MKYRVEVFPRVIVTADYKSTPRGPFAGEGSEERIALKRAVTAAREADADVSSGTYSVYRNDKLFAQRCL